MENLVKEPVAENLAPELVAEDLILKGPVLLDLAVVLRGPIAEPSHFATTFVVDRGANISQVDVLLKQVWVVVFLQVFLICFLLQLNHLKYSTHLK